MNTSKILFTLSIFLITSLFKVVSAQDNGIFYSAVYSDEPAIDKGIPLWGHNASKACVVGGTRLFVQKNLVSKKPVLYKDNGSGWTRVAWDAEDAYQNPVLVCDSQDNIHVIYNNLSYKIIHYQFSSIDNAPTKVDIGTLSSYKFNYIAAASTEYSSNIKKPRIFLVGTYADASYKSNPKPTPFNSFRYEVTLKNNENGTLGEGKWLSAQPLVVKFAGGFGTDAAHVRSDGRYTYPVIAATGHSFFTAAGFKLFDAADIHRNHWTFWDYSNYGKTRSDHFYFDQVDGSPAYYESTLTHNYTVTPNAIKLNNDGVIYVLSSIRGPSSSIPQNEKGVYLYTYANRVFQKPKHPIPNAQGNGGMTAQGDMIFLVDKSSIHWSCDKGITWQNIPNEWKNNLPNNMISSNSSYTHVMSDLVDERWIDAFLGVKLLDASDNKLFASVINIRIDTKNYCN